MTRTAAEAGHRGRPTTIDLLGAGRELLADAREGTSGRAARTLVPVPGGPLRQVLVALVAGAELAEHRAPAAASLLVLDGATRVTWDDHELVVTTGGWTAIPDQLHGLVADQDTIALLTVADGG